MPTIDLLPQQFLCNGVGSPVQIVQTTNRRKVVGDIEVINNLIQIVDTRLLCLLLYRARSGCLPGSDVSSPVVKSYATYSAHRPTLSILYRAFILGMNHQAGIACATLHGL